MRIYLVVNISQVVRYREQVKEQKVKEVKPVEVDRVEKWEVEKILNKRKIREVVKYLIHWKMLIAESDTWKREEDIENAKEVVAEFENRLSIKVRRQEKLDLAKKRDFRNRELLEKYIAKKLYKLNNRNFEDIRKELVKMKVSFSEEEILKRR